MVSHTEYLFVDNGEENGSERLLTYTDGTRVAQPEGQIGGVKEYWESEVSREPLSRPQNVFFEHLSELYRRNGKEVVGTFHANAHRGEQVVGNQEDRNMVVQIREGLEDPEVPQGQVYLLENRIEADVPLNLALSALSSFRGEVSYEEGAEMMVRDKADFGSPMRRIGLEERVSVDLAEDRRYPIEGLSPVGEDYENEVVESPSENMIRKLEDNGLEFEIPVMALTVETDGDERPLKLGPVCTETMGKWTMRQTGYGEEYFEDGVLEERNSRDMTHLAKELLEGTGHEFTPAVKTKKHAPANGEKRSNGRELDPQVEHVATDFYLKDDDTGDLVPAPHPVVVDMAVQEQGLLVNRTGEVLNPAEKPDPEVVGADKAGPTDEDLRYID